MIWYILILVFTYYLAVRYDKNKPSFKFFFSYCLGLALFVGVSDMLGGYDRYIYGEVFDMVAKESSKGILTKETWNVYFGHEHGYGVWNWIIAQVTGNRYIFILFTTITVYILYANAIYKTCEKPFFSLFIFLGLTFFFTFTYLRQVMAMGIVWFSIPYVIDRKKVPFFTLVAIASLFHNSAALFALLYFIPQRKFVKNKIIMVMVALLLLGLTNITGSLFAAYGSTVSAAAAKGALYEQTANHGFRIEYFIEAVLFLWIYLKHYEKITVSKADLVMMNAYLMFVGILFFFVRSSDGGRLAWYGVIGILAFLPRFCGLPQAQSIKKMVIVMTFVLYIRILYFWGILLYPYKTFFTDGHRNGDIIYELYEYDANYDTDKLQNLWSWEIE